MKFKNLLLLLAISGATLSVGQTDSNCTVPLSCREFDFYAEKVVRCAGLQKDTTIMSAQILAQDKIINQYERLIEEDSLQIAELGKIADTYEESLAFAVKATEKAQKRAKRRGLIALSLGSLSIIETIIIIICLL